MPSAAPRRAQPFRRRPGAATGSPRPPRGSHNPQQREDVAALARRLFEQREPPEDVLAGRAPVLGEHGAAALISRAADVSDDDEGASRRAARAQQLRHVVSWMSSCASQGGNAPGDAALWERIVASRRVKVATMRTLVRLREAEETLRLLELETSDDIEREDAANLDDGYNGGGGGGGGGGDDDVTQRGLSPAVSGERSSSTIGGASTQVHWTEDIRLEALASLGQCEEACASLRLLENASTSHYCIVDDGLDREETLIARHALAIRACVDCQRSALALLRDLESRVMLGNTKRGKKGVAAIARDSHGLLQRAQAAAIDACARAGDWESALGILRRAQLQAIGVKTNPRKKKRKKRKRRLQPVHTIIAAEGDAECRVHGCVADELYLSTIRACGAGRAWHRAVSVVREAEQCGVFTPELYSTAICALSPVHGSATGSGDSSTSGDEESDASARANDDPDARVQDCIRESLVREIEMLGFACDDSSSSPSSSSASLTL